MAFGGPLQTNQKKEIAAAPTVTGADNGLSLDGTIVQLGGPVGVPSPLLNARYIQMDFPLELQQGAGYLAFGSFSAGKYDGPALDMYFDAASNTDGYLFAQFSADNGSAFEGSVTQSSVLDDALATWNVSNGTGAMGMRAWGVNHATFPNLMELAVTGALEFRMSAEPSAGSFMTFWVNNAQRVRIGDTGCVAIAGTPSGNYALEVQNSGLPISVRSDNKMRLRAQSTSGPGRIPGIEITNATGTSVEASWEFALQTDDMTWNIALASGEYLFNHAGVTSMAIGNAGVAIKSGSVFSVPGAGGISTGNPVGGAAVTFRVGSLVTAAVTPDTTRYIPLEVGGVIYKVIIST